MYRLILIIVLSTLTACATKISKLQSDTDSLQKGQGYLLIAIDTNIDLHEIHLTGERAVKLTAEDLSAGSNYILVPLRAGTYRLAKIKSNKQWRYDGFEEEHWSFEVKPDVISYVGHLTFEQFGFWSVRSTVEMLNKSSMALEFLEEHFKTVLENRKVEYWGPGEDTFFEFVAPKNQQNSQPTEEKNNA